MSTPLRIRLAAPTGKAAARLTESISQQVRTLQVAAAVKDFVPIEGARRTFREIASIYRRFGGGDRVAGEALGR